MDMGDRMDKNQILHIKNSINPNVSVNFYEGDNRVLVLIDIGRGRNLSMIKLKQAEAKYNYHIDTHYVLEFLDKPVGEVKEEEIMHAVKRAEEFLVRIQNGEFS
jgi:translation elongation factor EF-4